MFNWSGGSGTSSPTLTHVTFSGNSAEVGQGGAIYNGGVGGASNPELAGVTFSGNSAKWGGAIYNDGRNNGTSSPTLAGVSFSDNSADQGRGGAMYNNGRDNGTSSPTLAGVTFSGNSAEWGGGVYNDGEKGNSSPTLTNVTFSGNSADGGAAMFNNGNDGTSSPVLSHVTVSGNSSNSSGGAIYANDYGSGSGATSGLTEISDSVFWGNTAPGGGDPNAVVSAGDSGNTAIKFIDSLIEGGCPDDNITCDGQLLWDNPLLGSLQDNGGFTQTLLPAPGSPVIDAVVCADDVPTDQRGVSRPQGARCDLGAVEVRQGTYALTAAISGTGAGSVSAAPLPTGAGAGGGMDGCTSTGTPQCSATYAGENNLSTITLSATPATGSSFAGWGDACASAGTAPTCTVTMDQPLNVTAAFKKAGTATVAPVPTLGQWAVLLLGLLLAGLGVGRLRWRG